MTTNRRMILRLFAGVPLLAASGRAAWAVKESRIGRLMQQARTHAQVSQRVDFISRALLGARYEANTLIGGPRRRERFVVRDDAFDCVTYCEVVLAAAIGKDLDEFETVLRRIRYDEGDVRWDQRNHYFADWNRRIVENKICSPVMIKPSVVIEKTVVGEIGKRDVSITAIPAASLASNRDALKSGDVIGFVSRQPNLDFYHAGFVAFGKGSSLLLRHASQSHGRILDEPMDEFVAANGTKYVTVVRAEEPAPATT